MDSQTVCAALRDALAELYPEERDARVMVSDAGLDAKQITFSSRARTNWHNILAEALRQKRCEQLLEFVLHDYPDNRRLQDACAAYDYLLAQGGQIELPALLPGESAVQQIDIGDGRNV